MAGGGAFSGANGTTGAVTYTLTSSDLANAYAVSALGSAVGGALPGVETFEIFAEATIGSHVYDGLRRRYRLASLGGFTCQIMQKPFGYLTTTTLPIQAKRGIGKEYHPPNA